MAVLLAEEMSGVASQGSSWLVWATSEKEGAFGGGFCRRLPSWTERGLGNLGKPPSAYQEAKSDCYWAEWDWQLGGGTEKCLGIELPARAIEHVGLAPVSTGPLGLRQDWRSIIH